MPVNIMILGKEFMLEVFPPMLDQNKGDNLNLDDLEETVKPRTYWDMIVNQELPDKQLPTSSK